MDSNSPRIGKLFVFAMAGKAEIVVMICFDQLRSTGPSMGIMAIKTKDSRIEVATFLKVEPLLVVGFRMRLGISPDSRLKLVIIGQGFSYLIRFVFFVIPWVFKSSIGNAMPSRMALATHLQASFIRQLSGMDDFTFGFWRLNVFRARTVAFFTSNIELDIFGFIPFFNFFQFEAGIVTASTAHFK
jgi:hypothetical protein